MRRLLLGCLTARFLSLVRADLFLRRTSLANATVVAEVLTSEKREVFTDSIASTLRPTRTRTRTRTSTVFNETSTVKSDDAATGASANRSGGQTETTTWTVTGSTYTTTATQTITSPCAGVSGTCYECGGYIYGVALNSWWTSSFDLTVATVTANYIQYDDTLITADPTTYVVPKATAIYGTYPAWAENATITGLPTDIVAGREGARIYGESAIYPATTYDFANQTFQSPAAWVNMFSSGDLNFGWTQFSNGVSVTSGIVNAWQITPTSSVWAAATESYPVYAGAVFTSMPEAWLSIFLDTKETVPGTNWSLASCSGGEWGMSGEPTAHIPVQELTAQVKSTLTVSGNYVEATSTHVPTSDVKIATSEASLPAAEVKPSTTASNEALQSSSGTSDEEDSSEPVKADPATQTSAGSSTSNDDSDDDENFEVQPEAVTSDNDSSRPSSSSQDDNTASDGQSDGDSSPEGIQSVSATVDEDEDDNGDGSAAVQSDVKPTITVSESASAAAFGSTANVQPNNEGSNIGLQTISGNTDSSAAFGGDIVATTNLVPETTDDVAGSGRPTSKAVPPTPSSSFTISVDDEQSGESDGTNLPALPDVTTKTEHGFLIADSTLLPGESLTISGTTYALPTAGSEIYVNDVTVTLPSSNQDREISLGDIKITPTEVHQYVVLATTVLLSLNPTSDIKAAPFSSLDDNSPTGIASPETTDLGPGRLQASVQPTPTVVNGSAALVFAERTFSYGETLKLDGTTVVIGSSGIENTVASEDSLHTDAIAAIIMNGIGASTTTSSTALSQSGTSGPQSSASSSLGNASGRPSLEVEASEGKAAQAGISALGFAVSTGIIVWLFI